MGWGDPSGFLRAVRESQACPGWELGEEAPWADPGEPITASALIVTSAPREANGHERDHREAHAARQLSE